MVARAYWEYFFLYRLMRAETLGGGIMASKYEFILGIGKVACHYITGGRWVWYNFFMDRSESIGKFASGFFELVGAAKKICITCHRGYDDDSIASVLAMRHLLVKRYSAKEVEIVCSGQPGDRYKTFKDFDKIRFVNQMDDHIGEYDLLILLDGSEYHRFVNKPEKLADFPGKTICLDHHSTSPDKFDLSLIVAQIPSCVEIIYHCFFSGEKIDKALAEIFMLGILGDTNNFAYVKPTQGETYTVARLMAEAGGIEIQEFQARYNQFSRRVFAVIQEMVKNTRFHRLKGWPDFQTSFVDREFVKQGKYTDSEVADAGHIYTVYYFRQVSGYRWGFLIVPIARGECSISLRSLPGAVMARKIVEKMGIGGGHDLAAGGLFGLKDGKVREVKECFKEFLGWMKRNKQPQD